MHYVQSAFVLKGLAVALARQMRVGYRPNMSDDDNPLADHNVRGRSLTHFKLAVVFPEWNSARIARWLGINPRTLQRMLSKNPQIAAENPVPEWMSDKIAGQDSALNMYKLGEELDDVIKEAKGWNLDDEVIAAWLAHRYKKLLGKDIE